MHGRVSMSTRTALSSMRFSSPALATRVATVSQRYASTAAPLREENIIPVSNIEAQWATLTKDEQLVVHRQLEELQKKDWKSLSLDEKRAAYYVAFGPHGPRKPSSPPGQGIKVFTGVALGLTASVVIFLGIRSIAPPPPKTMTREWQEAANERAKEQKENPLTGITSEGYKGPGNVQ